jgi:RNA polymerase II subunit A small phosphatase-like protein
MADSLITQVRNPNDNDFTPHPPDDEEEDVNEKEEPTIVTVESKSCWSFLSCCCWGRNKTTPQKETQLTPTPVNPQPTYQQNQNDNNQQPDPNQQPYAIGPPPKTAIKHLLPPLSPEEKNKKTLVLDLDETLVHSSFKPIPNADFVISIELESVIHRVYVLKRPGVDNFLRVVGQKFEVVVFTASLAKYADPLLDILDRSKVVKTRLFREACVHHYGNYVKDLSHLGRKLESTIIIDNSPFSYMFQPDNAIPITSWFNDKNDRQLYDLLPFLDSILNVDDVCTILQRRKPQLTPSGGGNMP